MNVEVKNLQSGRPVCKKRGDPGGRRLSLNKGIGCAWEGGGTIGEPPWTQSCRGGSILFKLRITNFEPSRFSYLCASRPPGPAPQEGLQGPGAPLRRLTVRNGRKVEVVGTPPPRQVNGLAQRGNRGSNEPSQRPRLPQHAPVISAGKKSANFWKIYLTLLFQWKIFYQ